MTTENWINVAMIIAVIITAAATLLGPVLAVIVQVRMSQPMPMPDANQLAAHRPGRFGRFMRSPGFRFGLLLWTAFNLIFSVWTFITEPLSRSTISVFVVAIACLMFQVLDLSIATLWRTTAMLSDTTAMLADTTKAHQAVIDETKRLAAPQGQKF